MVLKEEYIKSPKEVVINQLNATEIYNKNKKHVHLAFRETWIILTCSSNKYLLRTCYVIGPVQVPFMKRTVKMYVI